MATSIKGLFGGGTLDEGDKNRARDFVNRYSTGDPKEGYSKEEAADYFKQVSRHASPDQMKRALQSSINNLPEDDRKKFNEMLQQRQAGKGMIDIERTGERHATTSRSRDTATPGMDDMLGGLLGGMSGGSAGGGLGDILGGVLGGANQPETAGSRDRSREGESDGGVVDMLGDFMSSGLGKAVVAGAAAFAMKELLDQQR